MKSQEIIKSGGKAAGISHAWDLGFGISSIDSTADLDPMINPENEESDDWYLLTVYGMAWNE